MNKKQYEEKRKNLLNEAQELINQGKSAEAQSKMQEVRDLDAEWERTAQAMADFAALNNNPVAAGPLTLNGRTNNNDGEFENAEDAWKSDVYVNAWAKTLMGKPLDANETKAYKMVNEAYTHTTGNTAVVIPNTVAKGIWEMAGEIYPYFQDVTKTYVNGVLSLIQEDTSTEAKWYDEATATEDGKETFKEFQLSGCELSRDITVSWKLKEMAIEDFIPYIQRKLAKKMGAAASYGATHGKGANADTGKPEPMGTVTALLKEDGTPQVVTYAAGTVPTYANIVAARGKVKSGYGEGLNVYANSNTIWTKIAAIVDLAGRPLFVPDPTNQGQFRVLGMAVKEDDSMLDGEILFSNPRDGYHCNVNKETTILPEEHVKERKTDYCAYAIMDGNVTTNKAHALLTEGE